MGTLVFAIWSSIWGAVQSFIIVKSTLNNKAFLVNTLTARNFINNSMFSGYSS